MTEEKEYTRTKVRLVDPRLWLFCSTHPNVRLLLEYDEYQAVQTFLDIHVVFRLHYSLYESDSVLLDVPALSVIVDETARRRKESLSAAALNDLAAAQEAVQTFRQQPHESGLEQAALRALLLALVAATGETLHADGEFIGDVTVKSGQLDAADPLLRISHVANLVLGKCGAGSDENHRRPVS